MIYQPNINNTIPVSLEYAIISDVDICYTKNNSAIVAFYTGKSWNKFYSTLYSFKIIENLSSSKFGIIPESEVEFSLGGNSAELVDQITTILNSKLIIKLKYADTSEKIIGTKNKPCMVSLKTNNEMNPYKYFKIIQKDILRFLNLTDYPAGFTAGFSIGFNS